MPLSAALSAKATNLAGVRCAETTLASKGIASSDKTVVAACMVSQSDWDPMMMLTKGLLMVCSPELSAFEPN
jgi:hypothetical protein